MSVSRYKDLDGDIEVLEAYGETVEKLDGYYHCNYGWESSDTYHSERYFYPIPDSGDYYDVTISWANVEAWEPGGAQLALEKKQLKMMAESFGVTELVNDLTVVPLTGYEAHDTILAEVADAQAFAEYGMHDLYDRENTNDFSDELLNESYQTVGWTLQDLDGDGTPELLMGGAWSDGYTPIFNIYKLEDGKAVRLLYGWNRSTGSAPTAPSATAAAMARRQQLFLLPL